jgi:hypothetical protein
MSFDYLFKIPSTLSGAARTLDLFGQFDRYNNSSTPREADARAMISDMMEVASDISYAEVKEPPVEEKQE